MAKAPEPSWLRDRDIIGAWAFRGVAIGLLSVVTWNVLKYTSTIDTLQIQVPLLTNTVAALTETVKSEQAQITKLWEHIFEDAAFGRQQKK